MDPGNEILIVSKWMSATIGTLSGAVSGAYLDLIPSGIAFPAVRYHAQYSTDTSVVEGVRVLARIDWLVVVVREGLEVAPLVPIAASLDTVLHLATGTADALSITCVRQQPFGLVESAKSGVQYRHVGGIYRTIVVKT